MHLESWLNEAALGTVRATMGSIAGPIDQILAGVTAALQITDTQYATAESAYDSIGTHLNAEDSILFQFDPLIYPQGSMAIGTTVRPWRYFEYDVDLVLLVEGYSGGPMSLYSMVHSRLLESKVYAPKLQLMKRCIRVVYAGAFHLDVLPARVDLLRGGSCIEVPDRRSPNQWKPSNPLGFKSWFEHRSTEEAAILAKAAQVALPANLPSQLKTVLQQVVQLMKRRRDLVFKSDDDAPRSVILTTLAASLYRGESSVSRALIGVLERLSSLIRDAAPGQVEVRNPTNPHELFSEQWHQNPQAYKKFADFISQFLAEIQELTVTNGIDLLGAKTKSLFGETVGEAVMKAFTGLFVTADKSGLVRSTRVGLTTVGVGRDIPRNTNYGSKW